MGLGQARVIEAIASVVIIIVLAALLPTLFRYPSTSLRSDVQVGVSAYAYNVLSSVYSNPSFLDYISSGNWGGLDSLMNAVAGPQYDWSICVEPLYKAVNYKVINNEAVVIPLLLGGAGYANIQLNIKQLNEELPIGYSINTSIPMANILMATGGTATKPSEPVNWWVESYNPSTGIADVWIYTTNKSVMLYVSSNPNKPYDPINISFVDPLDYPNGGLSNFTASIYKAQEFASGYKFFGGLYGNGTISYLSSNPNANCQSCNYIINSDSFPHINLQGNSISMYYIGQLMTVVPGSNVSITANIGVAINVNNNMKKITNETVGFNMSFTNTKEKLQLFIVNGSKYLLASNFSDYIYVYKVVISIDPSITQSINGYLVQINYIASIYDYVTGQAITEEKKYTTTFANQPTVTVSLNGLNITQEVPANNYQPLQYMYNTTSIVYDVWASPQPVYSFVNPVTTSYACLNNVIPFQYSLRYPALQFTPISSAYTVIQLPNGSYYLFDVSLGQVSG